MLAALLLMGVATVVAAPVLISSMSADDVDEIPTEPDDPALTDLFENETEFSEPTSDPFDVAEPSPDFFEDLASPVLSPVSGVLPDIPADDLVGLDGISPIAPIQPDLPDLPDDDVAFDEDQILKPVEDLDLRLSTAFPPVSNIDDTVDEVAGPQEVAQIWDFVPGEDLLDITIFTDLPADAVTVEVTASEDGQDSMVLANDQLIAVLRDVPDAELADIVHSVQLPLAS